MPFGEIVLGPPGSGKSTYCHAKHQLFEALGRPIAVVNLDPANDNIPYPCAVNISEIITLRDVMNQRDERGFGLGPNGGMLFCMEYLEENFDWLVQRLDDVQKAHGQKGRDGEIYVLFDVPGQVELSTNHDSLQRILRRLEKTGYRVAAVHLTDSHYITDPAKYIAVVLLSLRAMLQLGLPHINVLSKIDLLASYGPLDFNLDFYTEVQDLTYLENLLSQRTPPKFKALNLALIDLIQDQSLVGFETLAVESKDSMLHLMRVVDRAVGCIFVPPKDASHPAGTLDEGAKHPSERANEAALWSSAMGELAGPLSDVRDVQERWIDERETYDAFEKESWKKEAEKAKQTLS